VAGIDPKWLRQVQSNEHGKECEHACNNASHAVGVPGKNDQKGWDARPCEQYPPPRHELPQTLQGMNFFVVWQRPLCVGKAELLEHENSKALQGMNFRCGWAMPSLRREA